MTAATAVRTTYTMPAADGGGGRRGSDERALVVLAQQGSSEAFAALVRLHQRRAYAVCRAIVLTHEDAEDAVQEEIGRASCRERVEREVVGVRLDKTSRGVK